MWGLFVFAPLFANYVELPLMSAAPPGSIWDKLTTGVPNGTGILAASIILAIMILPFMAATLRELLHDRAAAGARERLWPGRRPPARW